ncbi:MAG: cell wall hydrolase [Roseburia sp.]
MKNIHWKRNIALFVAMTMLFATSVEAETTQEDIDNAQSQIEDLQQQKEEAQSDVSGLEEQKADAEGEISSLNNQLSSINTEINQLEEDIAAKEKEIAEANTALAEAEAQAEEQYEAMKIRIQYMYENGGSTMIEMMLSAESIADFLNRTEYIADINEYDRNMLESYNQLKIDIAKQKEQLETEKTELLALEGEMKEKKEKVDRLIANAKSNLSAITSDLASAQGSVEELDNQIAEMEKIEEELERQKAAEDAARLAEIRAQEEEDTSGVEVVATESDLYLLGAIIQCEAEGEPYEGKLAVGSVIINRVRSSYFPNTVSGVIYQSGQFSPVASGRLAYRLEAGVNSECLQAAQSVLDGNITINCLYFRRNNGLISGTVIGNHVFY